MRKILLSLLAILFFVFGLCACDINEPQQKSVYFCGDAVIKTKDITLNAKVDFLGHNNLFLSVMSPKTVKGLCYQLVGSSLYISYDNLECVTKSDYLPQFSPINVIIDSLVAFENNCFKLEKYDGKYAVYKDSKSTLDTKIYVDKKSGAISRISAPYADCEVQFSGVTKQ